RDLDQEGPGLAERLGEAADRQRRASARIEERELARNDQSGRRTERAFDHPIDQLSNVEAAVTEPREPRPGRAAREGRDAGALGDQGPKLGRSKRRIEREDASLRDPERGALRQSGGARGQEGPA